MMKERSLLLSVLLSGGVAFGVEPAPSPIMGQASESVDLPSLDTRVFEVLYQNSPFTRSVDPANSLLLTGVATIQGEVVATLFDTATGKSQVISKEANQQGWALVGLEGDGSESRTWRAQVRLAGGEVVEVRYQRPPVKGAGGAAAGGGGAGGTPGSAPALSSSQLAEAKKAAVDYREGFSSDGYPNRPPPEMVEKLSRLSVSQREEINRQMLGYRNQGLGLDERRRIYENLVDRTVQGRR